MLVKEQLQHQTISELHILSTVMINVHAEFCISLRNYIYCSILLGRKRNATFCE